MSYTLRAIKLTCTRTTLFSFNESTYSSLCLYNSASFTTHCLLPNSRHNLTGPLYSTWNLTTGSNHSHHKTIFTTHKLSSKSEEPGTPNHLSDDVCPQGIQGDDCATFKLWIENCRRYGFANCNEQLQGIQTGRKTIAEVMAEQNKQISDIAKQYKALASSQRKQGYAQGVQSDISAYPEIDTPCPQGVQGEDCARFKLWLENCHRFGFQNCTEHYSNLKAGKQSLAEIFEEQDRTIREAAILAYQHNLQQRRKYSTSAGKPDPEQQSSTASNGEGEGTQLTQRQKLKRAVTEYGGTVIVFHVTISLMSLGFFYLLVSSGIDIAGLLMKLGIGATFLQNKLAAETGTFVVAYAVHKVFAPVRIATTLTATPFIVQYLRRVGILKVPGHAKVK